MIHTSQELLRHFIGQRPFGANDDKDYKDWIIDEKVVAKIHATHTINTKDILTKELAIYTQDQKREPSCTAFALAHAISHELTKQAGVIRTVSGLELWRNQNIDHIEALRSIGDINDDEEIELIKFVLGGGTVLTWGDSLQHALKCVRKYKCTIIETGEKVTIEYYRIPKDRVFKEIRDSDITIYTGSDVNIPMINSDNIFIPPKKQYGHAYMAFDAETVEYDTYDGIYEFVSLLNSWHRFGVKKTGLFYTEKEHIKYWFSAYAILPITI